MPDLKSQTINQVIKDQVNPKINVKTDGLLSYRRLNEVVKKHFSKVIPPNQAGKELPWVHNVISHA